MHRFLWCFVALTLLSAGCSDSGSSGDQSSQADGSEAASGRDEEGDQARRASLSGRWLVTVNPLNQPQDIHLAIVDLEVPDDGEFQASVTDSSDKYFRDAKVADAELSGNDVRLRFQIGETAELDIRGTFENGIVRGNAPTDSGVVPVTFVRTKSNRITSFDPVPRSDEKEFRDALESEDPATQLRQFARQHPESPTALTACLYILRSAKGQELQRETVQELAAEFQKLAASWGPRMGRMSRLEFGQALAGQGYLPELAVEILESFESDLTQEEAAELGMRVALMKGLAKTYHRYQRAKASEESGEVDEAIRRYAKLSVLPGVERQLQGQWEGESEARELPSEAVERLWRKKHGQTEGLEAFLDEMYAESIEAIATEPRLQEFGTRTSLIELFTGATCPPCVAADAATTALEAAYPKSAVTVIRHHLHIPGPDPLTTPESETRMDYYRGPGTPTVALNGEVIPNLAGPWFLADFQYQRLTEEVEAAAAKESGIEIELQADAQDGRLSLRANVNGLDEVSDTYRLRLVLAEDEIDFAASNGIRRHEMVVRAMPGGADGIAPEGGKLGFAQTISLGELKQGLRDYLQSYEEQFAVPGLAPRSSGGIFPVKPLELDALHLVAFVQDDATRQILQAAAVPVTGTLHVGPVPVEAPVPSPPRDSSEPAGTAESQAAGGPRLIAPDGGR